MMLDPDIRSQLRTKWIRQQSKIGNMIQEMEKELDRLRERKVNPAFIAEKSRRMDTMIDVVNYADEVITILSNENTALRIQLHLYETEIVQEATRNIENLKRFLNAKETPNQVNHIVNEIKQKPKPIG